MDYWKENSKTICVQQDDKMHRLEFEHDILFIQPFKLDILLIIDSSKEVCFI